MAGDYIPTNDGQFGAWANNLMDYANGHLAELGLVAGDLHNHDGELPDGIAEAFIKFAKKEKLSFWRES